ncbi:MAG TPA: peptide ABC transporter substrate-binding protein [Gaiellaceae bacterium]
MHRRRLWLVAGAALAALAIAATGSARVSGPDSASAKKAGTLVFGAEQGGGPDWCLNLILDVDCAAFWNVMFQTPVIRGAFLFTPQFTYKPDLISRYTLKTKPMRVTYYIRKNARWSDGVPVSGKDWRFTWQTAVNPKYKDHIDPLGWEDIRSITGNGKVVNVTFKRNFAAWRGLFTYVLPQHALQGTDMLTVWNDCICNPKKGNAPIGNGPFLLTRFDRGAGVTLTRNPRGWYGKRAKLDSIVFRFITNTNSEIQAIRSGEVDAIYPQPQLALADLRNQSGLRVVTHLGLQWEHIEIQQGAKGNPLAKQKWLRQALITSINRSAAAKALYGTLNPKVGVLNSLTRLTNEKTYNPKHFSKWNYNPAKVASMMNAHGCNKGGDGIYRCGGTKVSFDFASTTGNALRALAFTIFQDQAQKAGVELKNAFVPAGTLFGSKLPAHDFDLAMFTFLVTVDPHYVVANFSCGSGPNYTEYCNRTVTNLLARSDRELNMAKRLALVNKAGTIIGNDVPMIPLFQRPTYLVYKTSVKGMLDNPSSQGPSFNAENWSKG